MFPVSSTISNHSYVVSYIRHVPKYYKCTLYKHVVFSHSDRCLTCVVFLYYQVCSVASWDSSIHDHQSLNCITTADSRVYLILKVVLRLTHPAPMEVVLRKRLCVNVKHRTMSLTDKLKKKMWLTGVCL